VHHGAAVRGPDTIVSVTEQWHETTWTFPEELVDHGPRAVVLEVTAATDL
jgi:hypothetical protein